MYDMPKNKASIRLNSSPYKNEYIEMRKKGISVLKIYNYYLEKESSIDKKHNIKSVSYDTFKRWLYAQVPVNTIENATAADLTRMAVEIIERDREILSQLDENLTLLKALSKSLSSMVNDNASPQLARTLVEVVREIRQTIQTIIELRSKLKSIGMVSPRLVRDALVESVGLLPPEEQKLIIKRFDDVIESIVTVNVNRNISNAGDNNV